MNEISLKLKSLRENNGYTQKDIADILGTTQQTYCNYENSKYDIPIHHLKKLAEVYKVTSDYLLGFTSYKQVQPQLNTPFYKNFSYGECIDLLTSLSLEHRKSALDYIEFLLSKQK